MVATSLLRNIQTLEQKPLEKELELNANSTIGPLSHGKPIFNYSQEKNHRKFIIQEKIWLEMDHSNLESETIRYLNAGISFSSCSLLDNLSKYSVPPRLTRVAASII
jgi:hypothetical protein